MSTGVGQQCPLTATAVAERLGVRVEVVYGLIASGQLRAIDVSAKPGGRPRWRVMPDALMAFEAARASPQRTPPTKRRRRRTTDGVVPFF